jgi:hypothetical protein
VIKEIFCEDQLKDGVPEKLKALIVKVVTLRFVAETGVRESLR